MILTDDNFVTIVEAVKQGRNIYDNIRKAIHFLISTNIGEIVTIFFGLILGMNPPLLAIHLLWINLVTDSIPAIAIGLEPVDKNIMNKKPQSSKTGIFANGLWSKMIIEGIMIGALTLLIFSVGNRLYGLEVARTMTFISLGMIEMMHTLNVRSEESILKSKVFNNKFLVYSFIIGTIMQVGIIFIPPIAKIFNLVRLDAMQWLYVALISIAPILIVEIQKKFNEITFGKTVYDYKEVRNS